MTDAPARAGTGIPRDQAGLHATEQGNTRPTHLVVAHPLLAPSACPPLPRVPGILYTACARVPYGAERSAAAPARSHRVVAGAGVPLEKLPACRRTQCRPPRVVQILLFSWWVVHTWALSSTEYILNFEFSERPSRVIVNDEFDNSASLARLLIFGFCEFVKAAAANVKKKSRAPKSFLRTEDGGSRALES